MLSVWFQFLALIFYTSLAGCESRLFVQASKKDNKKSATDNTLKNKDEKKIHLEFSLRF